MKAIFEGAEQEVQNLINLLKVETFELPKLVETLTEREEAIDKLGNYICDDEGEYESTEEALQLLEKQASIDEESFADYIVCMWHPFEFKFTVGELLYRIGL